MKFLAIVVVCLILVLEVTAIPPIRETHLSWSDRSCSESNDCATDECCVAEGIIYFRQGKCMKLQTEGKECLPEMTQFDSEVLLYCPCANGFTCEPKQQVEIEKIGKVPITDRCVKKGLA